MQADWSIFTLGLEGQTLNVGGSNFESRNDKMLKCWNVKMLKRHQKSVIDVAVT